jgi:hypothetical protein
MKNVAAILGSVLFLAGCGSDSTAPASATTPRVTETFTTRVSVDRSGGLYYFDPIPTIRVQAPGQVDVAASFSSTADCQFYICVCQDLCRSCAIAGARGDGPTQMLSATGTLMPGDYQVLLDARAGGVSLCRSVPNNEVGFTHVVTAVHP